MKTTEVVVAYSDRMPPQYIRPVSNFTIVFRRVRCPGPNDDRRKEITWLVKKCHQKPQLRRYVITAERKWSLPASHQFCSAEISRISHSHVRNAVLLKSSGSSAVDDPSTAKRRKLLRPEQRSRDNFPRIAAASAHRLPPGAGVFSRISDEYRRCLAWWSKQNRLYPAQIGKMTES